VPCRARTKPRPVIQQLLATAGKFLQLLTQLPRCWCLSCSYSVAGTCPAVAPCFGQLLFPGAARAAAPCLHSCCVLWQLALGVADRVAPRVVRPAVALGIKVATQQASFGKETETACIGKTQCLQNRSYNGEPQRMMARGNECSGCESSERKAGGASDRRFRFKPLWASLLTLQVATTTPGGGAQKSSWNSQCTMHGRPHTATHRHRICVAKQFQW